MTPAEERLQHALSTRLSELQYRHLVVQAGLRDIPLSQALRDALERDIDARPPLVDPDDPEGAPRRASMQYRTMLGLIDVSEAVEQLREQGLAS